PVQPQMQQQGPLAQPAAPVAPMPPQAGMPAPMANQIYAQQHQLATLVQAVLNLQNKRLSVHIEFTHGEDGRISGANITEMR
ncbi:MAG: hypothetical protein ACR2QH_15085, partial [Geminicoccaceae bacterium]